jgi:hypothetical protein
MPRWDRYRYEKKCGGARYAELVFLHPVGAVGHVVHSGSSAALTVDALFLIPRWNPYGIDKKCARTRYAELVCLHLVGSASHVVHFG